MQTTNERPTTCQNCKKSEISWGQIVLKEEINGIKVDTALEKGFCNGCGLVYHNLGVNYILRVVNPTINQTVPLAEGDTLIAVWNMLHVFQPAIANADKSLKLEILKKNGTRNEQGQLMYDILVTIENEENKEQNKEQNPTINLADAKPTIIH